MADELPIRIPNLPMGKIVDDDGDPTDDELTFRQSLITQLNKLFGSEGCVLPSLTKDQIDIIVTNKNSQGQYTCAFGTMFYSTGLSNPPAFTNNQIWVTISAEDPLEPTKPLLKKVQLI